MLECYNVSGFTVIARRYDEATGFTVIARRYDEATGFTFHCHPDGEGHFSLFTFHCHPEQRRRALFTLQNGGKYTY